MSLAVLQDRRFYEFLIEIDRDLAAEATQCGCRYCGATLHSARYRRKPRGGPTELSPEYAVRFSFCCSADGCRRRHTPPSVRFLGSKVFVGVAVVLITAMRQGPTPKGRQELSRMFQVSPRTLSRWRTWWREIFPQTDFWRRARSRFLPTVPEDGLPGHLLDRFQGRTLFERCLLMLKFLSSIARPCAASARAL